MAKFINLETLTYYTTKLKAWVQGLGYQTATQVDTAITGKGYQTSTQVESAISTATQGMATQSWVTEQGYQNATQVDGAITAKGYQTAQQVSTAIGEATANMATTSDVTSAVEDMATQTWVGQQGFQDAEDVSGAISSATAGMATQNWVTTQGYQTAANVSDAISAAVSSVYEAKGSTTFASLPTAAEGLVGDVYNVTDAFTTTAAFVEGSGKDYPAGTNVVCVSSGDGYAWDVLAGWMDTSDFVTDGDLEAVSTEEIDALFA